MTNFYLKLINIPLVHLFSQFGKMRPNISLVSCFLYAVKLKWKLRLFFFFLFVHWSVSLAKRTSQSESDAYTVKELLNA